MILCLHIMPAAAAAASYMRLASSTLQSLDDSTLNCERYVSVISGNNKIHRYAIERLGGDMPGYSLG
jgi:hypothetical protein